MIKEAIKEIVAMAVPNEIDYEGRKFTDKHMTALPRDIQVNGLNTNTLSSVVDYIKEGTEANILAKNRFIIHVESPGKVFLFKEMNVDKVRDCLINAHSKESKFAFGRFMDLETFIINLQSNFVHDENIKSLLSFVGSIKDDSSVTQEDDGITQRITAKSGISLARTTSVPNPITLCPYRTFSEIEQPQSAFVFRLKKESNGIYAALFEADGSAWENEAILAIKQYFKKTLSSENVIILA